MRLPRGTLVGYHIALAAGLGAGAGAALVPQANSARAATVPNLPEQQARRVVLEPIRGRSGAESVELRDLRRAEAELFPEVGSADYQLSLPHLWDQSTETAAPQGTASPLGPLQRMSRLDARNLEIFRGLRMPDIPVRRHARVAKYIKYFTTSRKGRQMLTTWLKRAGRYGHIIDGELEKRRLPKALGAVVYIESGFWPTARSKAGAVGLWQFMPQTGRAYGLVVDQAVDERRSIWRSTEAALDHLRDLYERFHSWDLAFAAYNVGYQRVLNRRAELGLDDFWSLSEIDGALPRETALYVPKVLAVAVIVNNLERFGLDDLQLMPPLRAAEIKVPPGVHLSLVARAAGTSLRKLREINPEFRLDTVPDRGGPAVVHIPAEGLSRAKAMLPQLLVKQGEDPMELHTSPDFDWGSDDLEQSGKSRLERTVPGAVVPLDEQKSPSSDDADDDEGETSYVEPVGDGLEPVVLKPGARDRAIRVFHKVESGDTVWSLANEYGVSERKILKLNQVGDPRSISIGKMLIVDVPPRRDKSAKK